eukprot:34274-Eustigmatos_ZCMA.PRE.1
MSSCAQHHLVSRCDGWKGCGLTETGSTTRTKEQHRAYGNPTIKLFPADCEAALLSKRHPLVVYTH